jgi:DNA-binding beta-propeller fold protein YncE
VQPETIVNPRRLAENERKASYFDAGGLPRGCCMAHTGRPIARGNCAIAARPYSITLRFRKEHTMQIIKHALKCLCGLAALPAAWGAATTTAYLPVCCNANSTVSIVDTAHHRVIGSFAAGPGSYAVALPNPGTAWVTNAGNNTISVVSLKTGAVRMTIPLKLQPWLIEASPDGAKVYVVTGMFTGNLNHYSSFLEVFDAKTGAKAGQSALPNDGLANPGLAVSPDSARVYATFDSQSVVVYDVATRKSSTWETTRALTWTATGTLTLSPDGGTLYTAGQVLTAWDTATATVKGTVNPPGPARTYSFVGSAVSSDGTTLYASYALQIGVGAGLAAIDTASLVVTGSASLGSELQQPVLSKDGSTLFVPDAEDSLLYVVGAASLTATASVALEGPIAAATLSADGSALFVPNSSTASALAVDTSTLGVIASIGVSGTANPEVGFTGSTNPAGTGNGSRIFVAGISSNSISEIDAATNKVARTFTDGSQSPSVSGSNPPAIMATPNGRQIYLAGSDYQAELTEIDTATGKVNGVPCRIGTGCEVQEMAALPDSSRVYLAGFGYAFDPPAPIFFYAVDTATLQIVASVKMTTVGPMAASPTGKFLYISTGSAISIFDTTQNAVTGSLPIGGVAALAFSPDGSVAYAASGSTLDAIDTASGEVTASFNLGTGSATGVAVTPDGSQVWVTLAKSSSVVVLNTEAGTAQTVDFGLTVSGVAFGVH